MNANTLYEKKIMNLIDSIDSKKKSIKKFSINENDKYIKKLQNPPDLKNDDPMEVYGWIEDIVRLALSR